MIVFQRHKAPSSQDCLITDNTTFAFECFHKIQHSKQAANTHCAFKLDLAKAYDRVDWGFMEESLLKLGFEQKWVGWVMSCVKSVRYTVKYNEELLEPFIPSRGLQQGDPLSPYLFLSVAEGLSCLLDKEVRRGKITPLKIARGSPGISNLLFADDSLLFFKACKEEAECIMQVLANFQKGSGQLLSYSKCSILFSELCPEATQQVVMTELQMVYHRCDIDFIVLLWMTSMSLGANFFRA